MSDSRSDRSRERMLGAIRTSLRRRGPLPDSVTRGLDHRLRRPSANPKPRRTPRGVEGFIGQVESVHAKVSRAGDAAAVADLVVHHLEAHDLPPSIVISGDPVLDGVPWSNRLNVERRPATGADRVSVTGAFAGIAETGSVVLTSGADTPTTLGYLPDDHIVVLRESEIVNHIEDVWARLRKAGVPMPRSVHLVTGPSKTADVEQTLQEGAHGPRRLHVIVLTD